MALFNFGKKKEEEKKTPACACSCGCAASEAESITNDCCPDLKEGEICCIKVLGAGCKSCHEQFEYTKQAVKDMGLSVEVEYITDMQKVMEYGVMSMILSRLVDTFFARISLTMQPPPKPHSTACVLPWEEDRHWQSRSSGCSSS